MSNVFISYATVDRDKIRDLAEYCESCGLTIWWDRELGPGDDFADVIQHQLEAADLVVVAWSEAASRSIWVRSEAGVALRSDKYLPVTLDGGEPPQPYEQIHTLDLSGASTPKREAWSRLIDIIQDRLDAAGVPSDIKEQRPRPPRSRRDSQRGWRIAMASAVLGGLTMAVGTFFLERTDLAVANWLTGQRTSEATTIVSTDTLINEADNEIYREQLRQVMHRLEDVSTPADLAVIALHETRDVLAAAAQLNNQYQDLPKGTPAVDRISLLHQIGALAFEADDNMAMLQYEAILELDAQDVIANFRKGQIFERRSDHDSAQAIFQTLSEDYDLTHLQRLDVDLKLAKRSIVAGDYEIALDRMLSVSDRARAMRQPIREAEVLRWAAVAASATGKEVEAARARDLARRSAELFEKSGLFGNATSPWQFLAILEIDRENFQSAYELFGILVNYERQKPYSLKLPLYLNSRGVAELELARYVEAEMSFQESRDIALDLGDTAAQSKALANLTELYFLLGEKKKACRQLQELASLESLDQGENTSTRPLFNTTHCLLE